MILKEADDRSADLAELKHLKDSAPARSQVAVQKQIDNIYAGLAGEREAAHFLRRQFGRSERVAVLNDLRLGVDEDFSQIDHVLIHRVQGRAWVLETKNYSGRMSCDEHGDWTVWRNGKATAMPSPLSQARRHCATLRLWFDENGYKAIKSVEPVVLISPTSSVNRTKLPPGSHVIKADNFDAWWEKQSDEISLTTAFGMVGRHMLSGMSSADLIALGEHLVRAHVPAKYDWRAMLRLPKAVVPAVEFDNEPTESGPAKSELPDQDLPLVISTAHGKITISRIPDGRYALRNDKNDELVELVKSACKGKARWNPRFRNWLIAGTDLQGILKRLRDVSGDQPSR